MACRFKFILVLIFLSVFASGCLSLRIEKASIGNAVPGQGSQLPDRLPDQLIEKHSTLTDALNAFGAPGEIINLEGNIVLVYEKGFYKGINLSLGIPLGEYSGPNPNLSGYGRLWKYDRLELFFSSDWLLIRSVYVKGSEDPFFKSLFRDKEPEQAQ